MGYTWVASSVTDRLGRRPGPFLLVAPVSVVGVDLVAGSETRPVNRCHHGRMDAAKLREVQAPLKQLYRDDPLSSRTRLEAAASFETGGVTTSVQTWSGPVRAGLHPATGGDGSDACSGDMLLQPALG
jgi:hypothetical protein